ncbi:MAG: NUDIX domain-containing protein [Nanoarchaeota archaeon]|nr:NUDIX domain-containing protein [Nanoarchaeota archaeon]MBU1631952.1 NUDIX domain-containing protein [Nanoarchaeota archaeon]MBU1875513.1 NUDIX domain-containing protein [Nanoarchaeota archaeon]
MEIKKLNKEEREKIFEFFIKNKRLKFSEIEKLSGLRSNHISYHLEQMLKDELIEKEEENYKLTSKAEKIFPFFAHMTGKEVGALPVVLVAIKKENKICLLKREKRPYQGYWGLIGGKLKNGESIEETAIREAKEETGLDCQFESINSVVHERLKEKDNYKHTFVLFLTTVNTESDKLRFSDEGKADWFDVKNLNQDEIIPSDYFMIKKLLNNKSDLVQVVIEEKNEKLINFQQF